MIPKDRKNKKRKSPEQKKKRGKFNGKSKSQPKQRNKFNPRQYLQALLNLQNTNCSTNRKSKNSKRDISSALTIATPALQKTISYTKIRSKSSFSHYKKKSSEQNTGPVILDVYAIITEQSNVQYTEKTPRQLHQDEHQIEALRQYVATANKQKNKNLCAIKIQRAWRNYQTYKMISEHYEIEKNLIKKQTRLNTPQFQIKFKKSDLQKTLKIKKSQLQKSQIRRDEQLTQTQKIINERCKQRQTELDDSPIFAMISESYPSQKSQTLFLYDMKQRQAERFNQAIDIISNKSKQKTKSQLIEELIKKFEQNKRALENDIQKQLQCIQVKQNQKKQLESLEQSQKSRKQNSAQIPLGGKQKTGSQQLQQVQNNNDDDLRSIMSDSGSFFFEDSFLLERPEIKIFDSRLETIKLQKQKAFHNLDFMAENGSISIYQLSQKRECISEKYVRQRKEVQKNRKEYLFSLTNLKKNALKCHSSLRKQSSSLKKLKKSFSAGNIIIKTVLEELKNNQIAGLIFEPNFIESLFNNQSTNLLLNTPVKSQISGVKESEGENSSIAFQSNTQVMKKYSQQIQQSIQNFLFEEMAHQIFGNQNLFQFIKGYVEQIFEFQKVTDTQILRYFSDIRILMPESRQILNRINQKINPTSLQILRIIRDLSFEIDEYQLIIPQQTFKKYRQNLQKHYKLINSEKIIKKDQLSSIVNNKKIVDLIYDREVQKNQKKQKYRNFERDLKIMYMKAVFNCLNQYLIETKSLNSFMNGRSSIGAGQLSFALRQYNQQYNQRQCNRLFGQVELKLKQTLAIKCSIPSFKNYADLQLYQRQIMKQIQYQSNENQYKWVNYMDEVLQIWQDISAAIIQSLINEATRDIFFL